MFVEEDRDLGCIEASLYGNRGQMDSCGGKKPKTNFDCSRAIGLLC